MSEKKGANKMIKLLVEEHKRLNELCLVHARKLNDLTEGHKNEMGVVSDEVRESKEFQILKTIFNASFESLRVFNSSIKKYNKERS